jgi:hypothetical protein
MPTFSESARRGMGMRTVSVARPSLIAGETLALLAEEDGQRNPERRLKGGGLPPRRRGPDVHPVPAGPAAELLERSSCDLQVEDACGARPATCRSCEEPCRRRSPAATRSSLAPGRQHLRTPWFPHQAITREGG